MELSLVGTAMTRPRATNILVAGNAIAYVAIGSLVLFVIIDIIIFLKYPLIAYDQLFLTAAALILVISLPLVMVLRRKGF